MAASELRFEFELAARLSMTVGELRDRMTAEEFVWWKALRLVENDEQIERS